jgi:translation initiation factor 2B subunit (eIF-2B alpha/beta/delta family)
MVEVVGVHVRVNRHIMVKVHICGRASSPNQLGRAERKGEERITPAQEFEVSLGNTVRYLPSQKKKNQKTKKEEFQQRHEK